MAFERAGTRNSVRKSGSPEGVVGFPAHAGSGTFARSLDHASLVYRLPDGPAALTVWDSLRHRSSDMSTKAVPYCWW